jgi:putative transcriptional regulator
MSPAHHPQDEILLDYAAGALAGPEALVIATHLALCATCRKTAQLLDDVGGVMLNELPAASVDADGLARLFDRGESRSAATPSRLSSDSVYPAPLLACMPSGPQALRWWPLLPGLSVSVLRSPPGGPRAWLLRGRPRRSLPRHGHSGRELVCVVEGSFSDETGTYDRGSFAAFETGLKHRVAAGQNGCLCVVSSEDGSIFLDRIPWLRRPRASR